MLSFSIFSTCSIVMFKVLLSNRLICCHPNSKTLLPNEIFYKDCWNHSWPSCEWKPICAYMVYSASTTQPVMMQVLNKCLSIDCLAASSVTVKVQQLSQTKALSWPPRGLQKWPLTSGDGKCLPQLDADCWNPCSANSHFS